MKYVITFAIVLMIGCTDGIDADKVDHSSGKNYSTVVVDSCEYIEFDDGIFDQRVYSITHKGNCKYCIERKKYEQLTNK